MATFGIDVSEFRGVIEWPRVAASGLATFASTRVIDGDTPDTRWQANAQGARDHIALPIAHARVKPGDQAARAGRFLDMVATIHDLATVGLMVDVEDQGVTTADGMAFCRAVHELVGRWPLAYVPTWWLARQQIGWTLPETPWWPSRYVPEPWTPEALELIRPPLHPGFAVLGPWQFTSSGAVPGVPPPVDRNVYFGTDAELGRLLRGETMGRYPAAEWRRVPGTEPAITPRTVIFHTMVGTLPGVDAYFRSGRSGGIESHFGVGGPWEGAQYDGVVWQWRSTIEQADANYHANDFAVSIETSDGGDPSRPWTPKQLAALVRLGNWLADAHGIPRRKCPAWDAGGFGWHVMFGAPGPWTPVAKTCPGAVRIGQLEHVVFPAIFAGTNLEVDMPLTDTDKQWFMGRLEESERRVARYVDHGDAAVTGSGNHHARVREDVANLTAIVDAVGADVAELRAALVTGPPPAPFEIDAAALAAWLAGSQEFLAAVANAVNDDAARRGAE